MFCVLLCVHLVLCVVLCAFGVVCTVVWVLLSLCECIYLYPEYSHTICVPMYSVSMYYYIVTSYIKIYAFVLFALYSLDYAQWRDMLD